MRGNFIPQNKDDALLEVVNLTITSVDSKTDKDVENVFSTIY